MPSRNLASNNPWITFVATYYNNDEASTGKRPGDRGYAVTASGHPTIDGVTISVDPNIIPLGTVVKVRFPDGHIEVRRADDTGSAIYGHKIDIFKNAPDRYLCQLGKPTVQIQIIN